MRLAEARKHTGALMGAGIMLNAHAMSIGKAGAKVVKSEHAEHRGSVISGHWAETGQRRAPPRKGIVGCPDVAAALIAGGWSVQALRACPHRHAGGGVVPQSTRERALVAA